MKRIIAAVLVLALTLSLCACKSSDYKEATELYEDERYERARDIFAELGDYEDSAQMVMECDYQLALEHLEAGEYEQALAIFEGLGDYEDSTQRITECNYQIALEHFDDGEYIQAREIFLQLGDYENSQDLVVQSARGMVIEYVKENEIPDKTLTDMTVSRVTTENDQLLLVYAVGMSGFINIDVRIGMGINLDGTTLVAGTEEVSNYAADWSAEAGGIVDINSYKSTDIFEWSTVEASGYNANGRVTNDESTLWLRMFSTISVKEMTAHLAEVLESSGLGLTMADIGFTSY